jgi:glyoxylate reductase
MAAQPSVRPRPKVIVTRRLPQAVEARMAELFDVELNLTDAPMSAAALADAASRCDVLVPTVTDEIDSAVFAAARDAGRLKLLANFGVGVDHIDLAAARAANIAVTNTPGVLTDDTADMVMALILSVPRRLAEGEKLVRSGDWHGWAPTGMLGHRITGKRLGIIGMGRIGRAVATRARAFGLTVHYHNRHRLPPEVEAEFEATWWDNLDAMLARVDIITINCPHTPETHHLVGAPQFALMQRQAYIINAARGEMRARCVRRWQPAAFPAPGLMCSKRNRPSIRACSTCRVSCCCRTWAARRSRGGRRWGRR